MSIAFDRAAGYYDESRGLGPEAEELVADRVEAAVRPGGRLLEIGVGTGRIALPLHRRGHEAVGIDLSLPIWSATGPRRPRPGWHPRRCCGPTPPGCRSPAPASTPCSRSTCST